MNTPYQSVYDEAISDRVLQKVGSRKFSTLDRKPSETELQSIKSVIDKLTSLKKELFTLLKKSKTQFKSLDKNVLKLKLKDDTYYKSYKQSLWSNNISSNYSDNIADVIFPGAFGKTIQEIQSKVEELETTYESFNYRNYKSKIPKELTRDYLLAYLNLDNTSNFDKGLRKGIRLGITPANYDGFYRLHMVNSPPDAFKSATGGIGLGKYLYLAVIHHCGHGFTDGSSDDALKVWNHVVKKRKDIYSFIAQDEIGENYILAISIKVPKQDVLEILNKWIKSKWFTTSGSTNIEKTFFGWLKYRKEKYGDEAIDLLDDGLYELFKKEIEELNKPVAPVIQKTNVERIDGYNQAEKIVDISNLELNDNRPNKHMSYLEANQLVRKVESDGWRLPTIQELYTMYNERFFIKNTLPNGFYWSSSLNRYDNAWFLDSGDGYMNLSIPSTECRVILVRQKQRINVSNIRIGNIEVKATDERNTMSFSDAIRNAPQGYRLPTMYELRIMYANKNRMSGFILPEDDFYWYLSSSDYRNDNSLVSVLNMDDGQEDFIRKNNTEKFLVRYIKDNAVSSNTKPTTTNSKLIIDKSQMTLPKAYSKYGNTLLNEKEILENRNEIVQFFQDQNNRSLANENGYVRFWTSEHRINEDEAKIGSYDVYNNRFDFDWLIVTDFDRVKYYTIRFKNKTSNNSNTSQGFGKGNRATSNTKSKGGKLANKYTIIAEKKTYVQHKIMFEDSIFTEEYLGGSSSLHSSFNELIGDFVRQNKPILEDGKFIFWCESDNLPCIGKYDIKGNYTSYSVYNSNSKVIYNQYYTIIKNF